jgi:hypothetical protein
MRRSSAAERVARAVVAEVPQNHRSADCAAIPQLRRHGRLSGGQLRTVGREERVCQFVVVTGYGSEQAP